MIIEKIDFIIDSNVENQISLPCKFDFDNSWIGKHKCVSCNEMIDFTTATLKDQGMLWEKKFSLDFLNEVVKKIKNTQTIQINGFQAIVEENFDPVFPVPVSPSHYTCDHCQKSYSIIYSLGCHDSNDKYANPNSKLCTCSIRQIISPALIDPLFS